MLHRTMISFKYPKDSQRINSNCAVKIAYILTALISDMIFISQIFEKFDEQLIWFIFRIVMCLYEQRIKKLLDSKLKSSGKFSDLTNQFFNTIVCNIQRVLKGHHIRIRIRFGKCFYLEMVSLFIRNEFRKFKRKAKN